MKQCQLCELTFSLSSLLFFDLLLTFTKNVGWHEIFTWIIKHDFRPANDQFTTWTEILLYTKPISLHAELRQSWLCFKMPHASRNKCNMSLIQQAGKEKLLILKPKTHNFNTTNISYMDISSKKIAQIFDFWTSQCIYVFKSSFVVNSLNSKTWKSGSVTKH